VNEPRTLADSLSGVCADRLSERRFEPFARRLFAAPQGSWQPVAGLCDGLAELPAEAAEIGRRVTAAPQPVPSGNPRQASAAHARSMSRLKATGLMK
jgi:hypothetical protein